MKDNTAWLMFCSPCALPPDKCFCQNKYFSRLTSFPSTFRLEDNQWHPACFTTILGVTQVPYGCTELCHVNVNCKRERIVTRHANRTHCVDDSTNTPTSATKSSRSPEHWAVLYMQTQTIACPCVRLSRTVVRVMFREPQDNQQRKFRDDTGK